MREFWQNGRKIAFTMSLCPAHGYPNVGDVQVMEEHTIGIGDGDPPDTIRYKHTASFLIAGDALIYLRGKYPQAEERIGGRRITKGVDSGTKA